MKKKKIISYLSVVASFSLLGGIGANMLHSQAESTLPNNEATTTYVENFIDENNSRGVKISAKVIDGKANFEYWNLLTLEELATGFTIKMSPEDYAVAEASNMKIFIEDAVDESNQIIVTAAKGTNYYGNNRVYGFTSLADDVTFNSGWVTIAGTEQGCVANSWDPSATNSNYGAAPMGGNFSGNAWFFDSPKEVGFSYNNGIVYHTTGISDGNPRLRIMSDLKDDVYQENSTSALILNRSEHEELIGRYTDSYVDNLFASGFVRLKFEFGNTNSDKVSFMITNVAGEAVTKVEDTTAPLIITNFTTNALVGAQYNLPELTIEELFSSNLSHTTMVKAPNGVENQITNNLFTPDQMGEYIITYAATDEAGNTGSKSYKIQAYETMPEVSFVKISDVELNDAYCVYETMRLPVFEARSALSLKVNNALGTSVQIKKDDSVLTELKIEEEIDYIFQEPGNYQIVYVGVDEFGNKTTYPYATFTVKDYPYIEKLPLVYANIGSVYVPTEVEALYKGSSYETEYCVLDENGVEIPLIDDGFIPTKETDYRLVYSVTVDGLSTSREQIIRAVYSPSEGFIYEKNTQATDSFVLPAYSKETGTGIYVKAKGSTTITWGKVIDLSQLSETDSIIKFLPYSEDGCGRSSYTIKLTDIYNPKSVIEIRLLPHADMSYSYINLSYDGRRLARYSDGAVKDWSDFGYTYWFGHGGYKVGNLFSLKCNYAEKQFYINKDHWLLLDLDDGSQVGFGREWEGFTTGEVYMEMSIDTSADYAGLILTEAAGTVLGGYSIDDKTAPFLYFNAPNCFVNNEGMLPAAVVNKEYPLVTATAYDAIFGDCEVNYTIYYNGETTNLYEPSMGDTFTPTKAGKYTYIISSLDEKGNKAIWTGEFSVYESLAAMSIAFGEYDVNTLQAGGYFRIPEILATGGSGVISYEYKMYLNGEEVTAEDCGDLYLGEVGELTFIFTAVDYIGMTLEKEITLQVIAPSNPVVFVSSLPNAAIYGQILKLPNFEAIDYNYAETEKDYNAYKCVKVNGRVIYAAKGGSVSGSLDYVVDTTGTLKVEYCSGSGASELTTIEPYSIPVITITKNADYIVPTDFDADCTDTEVTREASKNGITFITNGDKAFTMLNPVACDVLELRFSGLAGKVGQAYMDIVITDYANARNSILLRIQKLSNAYYLNVNGTSSRNILLTGSMEKSDEHIFMEYAQLSKSIITGDNTIAIEKNLLGNPFEGFMSGLVRVSFELHEVRGEGSVNIYKVGNQIFEEGEAVSDNAGPQIWYETAMRGVTMKKGSTLVISKATAQDVLCGASDVYVTVRTPNGIHSSMNNILADKTRTLVMDTFGYYTIIYTATDANGAQTKERIVYYCKDDIAPTLNVNGDVAKMATIGTELNFPAATYEDNYSECSLSVMVIAPDGSTTKVPEDYAFTPTMKGVYYVIYFLTDADYNMAIARYQMEVK